MKKIFHYLDIYRRETQALSFFAAALFTAIAVFCNYRLELNHHLYNFDDVGQFVGWYLLFLSCMLVGYAVQPAPDGKAYWKQRSFIALLLLAPAVFAWKMSYNFSFNFPGSRDEEQYWNGVVYWPLKLAVMLSMLWLFWRVWGPRDSFYGWTTRNMSLKPYWIMLLLMIPLIAAASTQRDFLNVYPKLQHVPFLETESAGFFHRILYELSYGSDFIGIELYFRGFLVLAFARFAGSRAILPMAIFYCAIHFGKPLGECISSFFGGIILGVVTYHTRSVIGGLIVHLGIAWLMELGGYVANNW